MDEWLRSVLWESVLPGISDRTGSSFEIHRTKGRIVANDGSIRFLPGVRELFELSGQANEQSEGKESNVEQGKIVIIGRRLEKEAFERSFQTVV